MENTDFDWNANNVAPNGGKIHHLKCWPVYFFRIQSGEKQFEVRKNDRDFQTGDYIDLLEWCPDQQKFTGQCCPLKITYILHGGQFGIQSGTCVLGIAHVDKKTGMTGF